MTLVLDVTDPRAVTHALTSFRGVRAFDIGANCGQTVARLLDRFDEIIAVEPAIESFEILDDFYADNDKVIPLNVACSSQDGTMRLTVQDRIDTGQLTDRRENEVTEEDHEHRWGQVRGTRDVPALTVDQLVKLYGPPDLLKIDVEGAEDRVLLGAKDTLDKRPNVLVEIHNQHLHMRCLRLLDHYGDIETIRHPFYQPGSWGYDNHLWLVAR